MYGDASVLNFYMRDLRLYAKSTLIILIFSIHHCTRRDYKVELVYNPSPTIYIYIYTKFYLLKSPFLFEQFTLSENLFNCFQQSHFFLKLSLLLGIYISYSMVIVLHINQYFYYKIVQSRLFLLH